MGKVTDGLLPVAKRRDASPTTMIVAGLSAVAASQSHKIPVFVGADIYYKNMALIDAEIPRVLATLAMVAGVVCCHIGGRSFISADPEAGFVENMLRMGGVCGTDNRPDPKQVKYAEKSLILYADLGMSNATTSFLTCASTRADPLSCLTTALGGLYGPLHGSAIHMVYKMLHRTGSPEKVPELIRKVKAKEEMLYGYGHRYYKEMDPRTKIVKDLLYEIRDDSNVPSNDMLDTALEIDRIAGSDDYFVKRGIKANPDLYTALMVTSVGIPEDVIVPMLPISRNIGFMAHWREFMSKLSTFMTLL